MLPSQIITMARNQTGTSTGLVTAPQAYDYLNILIADFWKDIVDNETGYWSNTWTYDLTAGTSSYTFATPTANTTLLTSTFGISQLMKIGVKYKSTDTVYTPVPVIYQEGMLNLPDYYSTATTQSPVAIIKDTSITIFPTPTSSVTNGLQIIWPKSHFPLGTTGNTVVTEDVEGCLLIPSSYHYVLVEGLKYWMYGQRWTDFDAIRQSCKGFYEAEKLRTIWQLTERNQDSSNWFLPDLTYLW